MEKWMIFPVLLMAFLAQTSYSDISVYYYQTWDLIDCGADTLEISDDGWVWEPDNLYISTGETKTLQSNNNVPGYMNSLRYFPDGGTNCYSLYPDPQYKFLFRAGFYYSNYDGLSKPPTFDILLDGSFWATVNTSASNEPIYHEILYKPKANGTRVCLVQTRQGEIPFISSLVMAYLHVDDGTNNPMYQLMGNDTALYLVSRNTFGGLDKVLDNAWSIGTNSCIEYTFRIWEPKVMLGYLNISYVVDYYYPSCLGLSYVNRPPDELLTNAISPENATDSIFLNVDFRNSTKQSAYFVFYFLDYNLSTNPNYTRKFEIHIDGALKNVVELNGTQFGQVVSLFPVEVSGSANVTISPLNGSEFAPILNGMEVYTASNIVFHENVKNSGWGRFKLCWSFGSLLFFNVIFLLVFLVGSN